MNRILLLVILAVVRQTAPGFAQTAPAPIRAAATVREGTIIRLRLRDGALVSGRFGGVSGDTILLDTGSVLRVRAEEIDSLWRGGRAAGKGARTGAIAGGISGAVALGTLAALLVEGLCETDDCNGSSAAVVGGLIGGAIGTGSGALLGAIIGSGVPAWKVLYPVANDSLPRPRPLPSEEEQTSGRAAAAGEGHIGALRVGISFARGTDRPSHGGSAGIRLGFLPRFGRNLWAGLEAGTQGIGGWRAQRLGVDFVGVDRTPQLFVYTEDAAIRVIQFAGVARVGKPAGRVRPYGVASAGLNLARMDTRSIVNCPSCSTTGDFPSNGLSAGWSGHAAFSIGGGVDLLPSRSRLSVGLEARMHSYPRFVTVGITAGTSW